MGELQLSYLQDKRDLYSVYSGKIRIGAIEVKEGLYEAHYYFDHSIERHPSFKDAKEFFKTKHQNPIPFKRLY